MRMSHRWDCPDRWEARREGERAFERGTGIWRNPYEDNFLEPNCPEAAEEWRRSYRAAEQREEERQAEERHQHRLAEQRREQEEYERMVYEQEYYARLEEERQQQEPIQEEPQVQGD
jgi:hypothetical protein